MERIESYIDLKKFLESHPMSFCWYGPRSTDVSELGELMQINEIISCYGSALSQNISSLINETAGLRTKFSVDELARTLILNGKLPQFIEENNISIILPYDSNPELEEFSKANHIHLLSSSDSLKDDLKDKTKIDEISRAIGLPTIPGIPGIIDEFEFETLVEEFDLPLFLHFAEGAGGSGNRIVYASDEFEKVKIEKRGRRLNAKKFFVGRTCTIDICVTSTAIICGTLEEELIGAEPLNSNPTEYVASSWFENDYSDEMRKEILDIGIRLGELLRSRGFIGCFHPDFLVGANNDIFLTELNMRFGASCGAYAKIQIATNQIPMMAIHALSFMYPDVEFDAESINARNLAPLDYALLVLKNNFGRPIKIPARYKSGLYKLSANTVEYIEDIKFTDFKDKDAVLLIGLPESGEDTIVEEGAFICEVITRFPISDLGGKLNADGKHLVESIFSKMAIQ